MSGTDRDHESERTKSSGSESSYGDESIGDEDGSGSLKMILIGVIVLGILAAAIGIPICLCMGDKCKAADLTLPGTTKKGREKCDGTKEKGECKDIACTGTGATGKAKAKCEKKPKQGGKKGETTLQWTVSTGCQIGAPPAPDALTTAKQNLKDKYPATTNWGALPDYADKAAFDAAVSQLSDVAAVTALDASVTDALEGWERTKAHFKKSGTYEAMRTKYGATATWLRDFDTKTKFDTAVEGIQSEANLATVFGALETERKAAEEATELQRLKDELIAIYPRLKVLYGDNATEWHQRDYDTPATFTSVVNALDKAGFATFVQSLGTEATRTCGGWEGVKSTYDICDLVGLTWDTAAVSSDTTTLHDDGQAVNACCVENDTADEKAALEEVEEEMTNDKGTSKLRTWLVGTEGTSYISDASWSWGFRTSGERNTTLIGIKNRWKALVEPGDTATLEGFKRRFRTAFWVSTVTGARQWNYDTLPAKAALHKTTNTYEENRKNIIKYFEDL